MASRARERREHTPGYKARPSKEDRAAAARRARRVTHQILSTVTDPEEVIVEEAPHIRGEHAVVHETHGDRLPGAGRPAKGKARRRVRKSPFWKRRYRWRREKAALDAQWPILELDPAPGAE